MPEFFLRARGGSQLGPRTQAHWPIALYLSFLSLSAWIAEIKKKSHGLGSGEYRGWDMTVTALFVKNCCTEREWCEGALSCYKNQWWSEPLFFFRRFLNSLQHCFVVEGVHYSSRLHKLVMDYPSDTKKCNQQEFHLYEKQNRRLVHHSRECSLLYVLSELGWRWNL